MRAGAGRATEELRAATTVLGVFGAEVNAGDIGKHRARVGRLKQLLPALRWETRAGRDWELAWGAIPAVWGMERPLLDTVVIGVSVPLDAVALSKRSFGGAWGLAAVTTGGGLVLGRDPAGTMTMYFGQPRPGVTEFCSNLVCFNHEGRELDDLAVAAFLRYLYIPAPLSVYEGVRALRPGEVVHISPAGTVASQEVASPAPEGEQIHFDAQSPEDAMDFLLREAVEARVSDPRRTALLLSGGKDSSALAVALHRAGAKEVVCAAVGFDAAEIDETRWARGVAEYLGLRIETLRFSGEDYLSGWHSYVRHMGQPFGDPTGMPLHLAFGALSGRFDTVLDGTGNDSYFGVPTSWQEDVAWWLHRWVPGIDRVARRLPAKRVPSYSVRFILHRLARPRAEQFVSWNGWTRREVQHLLGRGVDWSAMPAEGVTCTARSPVEHKTAAICGLWESEAAYRKTVQQAVCHGLTVRFPFLDERVMDFVRGLPAEERMYRRVNKILLRRFLRQHLPDRLVDRPKGYFLFPKTKLVRHCLRAGRFAEPRQSRIAGILDSDLVKTTASAYLAGRRDLEDRLWALVILEEWMEVEAQRHSDGSDGG